MGVCKYSLPLEHSTHTPTKVVGAKHIKLDNLIYRVYNKPPYKTKQWIKDFSKEWHNFITPKSIGIMTRRYVFRCHMACARRVVFMHILAKNAQTFLFLSLIFLLLWIYMFWMIFLAWGWWITLQMVEGSCDFFPLIVLGRYITCKKMFVGFESLQMWHNFMQIMHYSDGEY